jgi:hypothetical protein
MVPLKENKNKKTSTEKEAKLSVRSNLDLPLKLNNA